MVNWVNLGIEQIMNGTNSEGVRYLTLFLKDYKAIVQPTEPIVASCPKCIRKYFQELINHKTMEKTESKYKLKAKYEGITLFGTGLIITNKNLTDELGARLMKKHPAGIKLFEVYPTEEEKPKKRRTRKTK